MLRHFQFFYYTIGCKVTPDASYRITQNYLFKKTDERDHTADDLVNARIPRLPKNDEADAVTVRKLQRKLELLEKDVTFLTDVLAAIEPHRKYKDLTPEEGYQRSQRVEEFFELLSKGENQIFTIGSLHPDLMDELRAHPDFGNGLIPALHDFGQRKKTEGGVPLRGKAKWLDLVRDALKEKYPALAELEPPKIIMPEGGLVTAASDGQRIPHVR